MIAVAPRLRDYTIFSLRGLLAEMILDIQINDQANERMKTMTFPGQLTTSISRISPLYQHTRQRRRYSCTYRTGENGEFSKSLSLARECLRMALFFGGKLFGNFVSLFSYPSLPVVVYLIKMVYNTTSSSVVKICQWSVTQVFKLSINHLDWIPLWSFHSLHIQGSAA